VEVLLHRLHELASLGRPSSRDDEKSTQKATIILDASRKGSVTGKLLKRARDREKAPEKEEEVRTLCTYVRGGTSKWRGASVC
jgi:hypothetical protein